jgi:hypothetical protein
MKRLNDGREDGRLDRPRLKWKCECKWLKSCVFAATLATPMTVLAATAAPEADANGPVAPTTGNSTEEASLDFSQASYQPASSREPPRERRQTPAAQSNFLPAEQEAVRVSVAPASQSDYQPGTAETR